MTSFNNDTSIQPTATTQTGIVGKGIKFQRIRRITGYLVGSTDRFNNAKRREEKDRVKHGVD